MPLTRRHLDALVEKINRNNRRLEDEHESDFEDLWNFLCEVAETPDSVVLRLLLRMVRDLQIHVETLDGRVEQLVTQVALSTGGMNRAANDFLADN